MKKSISLALVLCFITHGSLLHAASCSDHIFRLNAMSTEWKLPKATERQIQELFDSPSLSDSDKLQNLFSLLMDLEVGEAPLKKQIYAKELAETLKDKLGQELVISGEAEEKMIKQLDTSEIQQTIDKIEAKLGPDHREQFIKLWQLLTASSYSPHFNPLSKHILYRREISDPSSMAIQDILVMFHEFNHAIDYSKRPWKLSLSIFSKIFDLLSAGPRILSPSILHQTERISVGSQWEIVSRIPFKQRQSYLENFLRELFELYSIPEESASNYLELIRSFDKLSENNYRKQVLELWSFLKAELETNSAKLIRPLESDLSVASKQVAELETIQLMRLGLADITLHSLVNAHLGKKAFLRAQMPIHQYDLKGLLKRSNKYGHIRYILALFLLGSIINWLDKSPDERRNFRMYPIDYNLYVGLLRIMSKNQSAK